MLGEVAGAGAGVGEEKKMGDWCVERRRSGPGEGFVCVGEKTSGKEERSKKFPNSF